MVLRPADDTTARAPASATSTPSGGGGGGSTFRTTNASPGSNWVLPVAGMASTPGDNWSRGSFGYKKPASKGGHVHQGTDIYADAGTAVMAPVSGTIISAGTGTQAGNYIKIRGIDGIEYYFAHMQTQSPWKSGQKIQAGIYIGAVGNTGNASGTSPHLHFGMKKNGMSVSPNDFLATGQQQDHTPLSSIPGLNTPEEIAAWAQEEFRRQSSALNAQQVGLAQQGAGNFDVGGIAGRILEGQQQDNSIGFGQKFLGATLNAFSNRMAGGERTPVPRGGDSSALDEGSEALTPAATQGVPVEQAVNPALQRQEVDVPDDQV